MISTSEKAIDGLLVSSQSNTAFWVLLISVGFVAVLFGLKLVLHDRDQKHVPHDHNK